MSETRHFTTRLTLEHVTTLEIDEMFSRLVKCFFLSEDLNHFECVNVQSRFVNDTHFLVAKVCSQLKQ